MSMKTSNILITKPSADYELLDSGEGEKLERFGTIVLSRPDPQALWRKLLPDTEWKKAHGHFGRSEGSNVGTEERGNWTLAKDVPSKWHISFGDLTMTIKPTAFKHTGLFPEQSVNWHWMREKIQQKKVTSTEDVEVLNLFGYTGGASLACVQAGAKVVHIDSSKSAVSWARDNAEASHLVDKPIRWIIEDARLFVERELKRGRSYDAILMDPPAFGHSPTATLWKIEEDFLDLIDECMKLLKPKPLFFLINGYSAGYSSLAYENNLLPLKARCGGSIEIGELALEEKGSGRLLPSGIFARWSSV